MTTLNVETEEQTRESIYFGLGCFQFVPRDNLSEPMTLAQYLRVVETDLLSLPYVKNVSIENLGLDRSDIMIEGVKPFLEDGFMLPKSSMNIMFDIHIPNRLQNAISDGTFRQTNTEDFHVHLRYGYAASPAIVRAVNPNGELDGSSCIYIVRKFLEQCMDESPSCRLYIDILGPSPFHARFEIKYMEHDFGAPGGAYNIETSIKKQLGYDDIEWTVAYQNMDSEEVFQLIYEDLS